MKHLLEVSNLRTYFFMHDHVIKAVDGVDFYVDRGETVGLVGESGCGKSVTSMSLLRLIPDPPGKIVAGKIIFENEDLVRVSQERMRAIRGNRISMIFQEPMTSLNPVFTVGHQIAEVLMLHRGMDRKAALAEAVDLLNLVGISEPAERVHEYPFQLSGGLRQRIMISMALACQPAILIADEPTTALDVTIQAQILRLMRKIKYKINSSIIFITHDLAVIANFADRVVVMYAGVVVENAPVREIFKSPSHPYTQGLLASIPVLGKTKRNDDNSKNLLSTIPGTIPDPKNFPHGCRFSPRCSKASEKCFRDEPALTNLNDNHAVRCFLYADAIRTENYT
ncbi:MAG: ABC transporter ATP-binding protein [Chitinivibrionales bacterium]|nr:ABC transporter ATP-binding protein [Chitinivibrionales bacterium]